jgi:1-acyl-sn-glycerol-3-phosphate acyltransferase
MARVQLPKRPTLPKLDSLPLRRQGFPYAKPSWPGTVGRPPVERNLGADFDTAWARSPVARFARAIILDNVIRPAVQVVASPVVTGLDRIEQVEGPAIFVANHASHLDTPLMLSCLPERFRHHTVVGAAADYFFDTTFKAHLNALSIAAFPVDRTSVGRRSLDLATALINDGWNLLIFPEGGRTPDGWARTFHGGTAFLARRCDVPVVPIHLEGTRRIWRKGSGPLGIRRSTVHVTFGAPLSAKGEDNKSLSARIERAVAVLADEQNTDWWAARQRAAQGTTPALSGPNAGAWRRSWSLDEGRRRPSGTRWPA